MFSCEDPVTPDSVHPRFSTKPRTYFRGLRVALVQLSVGKDKTKNVADAVEQIRLAKKNGAQLVALPECFNSPYGTSFFKDYAEVIPSGETSQALSKAAAEAEICVVGGTFPERAGKRLYNTCTVWDAQGNLVARHRKLSARGSARVDYRLYRAGGGLGGGIKGLKIALAQTAIASNKSKNIANAVTEIYRAKDRGCDMIVLPEFFYSFNVHNIEHHERVPLGEACEAVSRAAAATGSCVVGGTVRERRGDVVHNTCTVWGPNGDLLATYRKLHLFDIDIAGKITFRESDVLYPGNQITTFDCLGMKIGLGICYDLRFPEMAHVMAKEGCSLLIYPGAFNMTTGPKHWELLGRARAVDQQLWVALVSPARDTNAGYVAWGHSTLIDPWGQVVDKLDENPGTLMANIDLQTVEEVRGQIPIRHQRRTDIYDTVLLQKQ